MGWGWGWISFRLTIRKVISELSFFYSLSCAFCALFSYTCDPSAASWRTGPAGESKLTVVDCGIPTVFQNQGQDNCSPFLLLPYSKEALLTVSGTKVDEAFMFILELTYFYKHCHRYIFLCKLKFFVLISSISSVRLGGWVNS